MHTSETEPTFDHQATVLESDLDTIFKLLGRLNCQIDQIQLNDHLTDGEQRSLADALVRAENKMTELAIKIRGNA